MTKTFLDCGGELRQTDTCQMQAWVGKDERIPLEIEDQDAAISQYPVVNAEVTPLAVILNLITRHTDCLVKEKLRSSHHP